MVFPWKISFSFKSFKIFFIFYNCHTFPPRIYFVNVYVSLLIDHITCLLSYIIYVSSTNHHIYCIIRPFFFLFGILSFLSCHYSFSCLTQLGTLLRFTGKSTHVKMILSKLYVAKRSFPGNASSLVQAAFFSAWKGVSQLNME